MMERRERNLGNHLLLASYYLQVQYKLSRSYNTYYTCIMHVMNKHVVHIKIHILAFVCGLTLPLLCCSYYILLSLLVSFSLSSPHYYTE